MESEQLWLSIALGAGIGLAYIAVSFFSNKRALRSRTNFMLLVVSLMMLRMFIALILLIGIVLTLPVSDVAFLGSFFVIFIIGLVAEVWTLHRREQATAPTEMPDRSQSDDVYRSERASKDLT